VKELQSIVNYGTHDPAVDAAFNINNSGVFFCTVGECSLTSSDLYWSSTTLATDPLTFAFAVSFINGVVNALGKGTPLFVRAVRGCL